MSAKQKQMRRDKRQEPPDWLIALSNCSLRRSLKNQPPSKKPLQHQNKTTFYKEYRSNTKVRPIIVTPHPQQALPHCSIFQTIVIH